MRITPLRKLIIDLLAKHPIGRTGKLLWSIVKRTTSFTLQDFDETLEALMECGVIRCTNKRFWLSDSSRTNYAKVSNE